MPTVAGASEIWPGVFRDKGGDGRFNIMHADFGAVAGADIYTPLSRARDAAYAAGLTGSGGGVVVVPPNLWLLSNEVEVPENVVVWGLGRPSIIRATSAFPTNTPMFRLERSGDAASFGNMLYGLNIDCNNIAGSIGVRMVDVNQQGGVKRCVIQKYRDYGIKVEGAVGSVEGSSAFVIDEVEPTGSSSGSNGGISVVGCVGRNTIRDTTSATDLGGSGGTYGIYIENSEVSVHQHSSENHTHSLFIGSGAYVEATGIAGHLTTGTVVTIAADAGGGMLLDILAKSSTTLINDLAGGNSIAGTETHVPIYALGSYGSAGDKAGFWVRRDFRVFGQGLRVPVRTGAPLDPGNGMIVYADGATWNPIGDGLPHFVGFLNGAWVKLDP